MNNDFLKEHKKLGGFWRPNSTLEALESGQFTKINAVTKRVGNEQNKVFAYSKVINAVKLKQLADDEHVVEPNFDYKPYINCIAVNGVVIGYIWDTREIVTYSNNKQLADIFSNADWEDCVPDYYDGRADKPLLTNPHKLPVNFVKQYITGWMQPTCFVNLYKARRGNKGATSLEYGGYEICTATRDHGIILIGLYDAWPDKNKYELQMSYDLLKDVWPYIKKSCEKYTNFRASKPMSALDIQYALMNGLTM